MFGVSTPVAKLLLGEGISPWLPAGVLYLGSGLGLGAIQVKAQLASRYWTHKRCAASSG
jgi:hypothetical protein